MWLIDLVLTLLGGGLWLMIYAFSGNAKKATDDTKTFIKSLKDTEDE